VKIIIGGDVCPIGRNESLFSDSHAMKRVQPFFEGFDFALINLECPLIENPSPILKGGPVLGVNTMAAKGLAMMGVNIVSLSNNHIMDHGATGLCTTLSALSKVGINSVGAGSNIEQAGQPLILRSKETDLAVLAFAEKEYSYATDNSAGACPLDIPLVVRKLRSLPDHMFSVILVHGGNENYPYPNPWLKDTCRLMVELGANVVVCQHSHCIGSYEVFKGGLIVYGQGNLIFDLPSKRPTWWESILIQVEVKKSAIVDFQFNPIIQDPGGSILKMAEKTDKDRILLELEQRSILLADKKRLHQEWQKFCLNKRRDYQSILFGYGRLLTIANKLIGFADWFPKKRKMNVGNIVRCASHLEVLKKIYSLDATTGNHDRKN
jgi:poly-gamma-glutamate capsule biosynthesis protein CapA/YwtB (metallophosphatase superfamily)